MKKFDKILMCVALLSILFGATSCNDGFVYDEGGDCFPKVQFIFKKHRHALDQISGRETDAFYSTVESVHLFVYNVETGELVFEQTEKTDNLLTAKELGLGDATERCFMNVDLNPGKYRFVAWCGLDESDNNNAFRLTEDIARSGNYAHCEVKKGANGHPVNMAKYEALYHGVVPEIDIVLDANSPQTIPIELTKNTNDISIWVQHTTKTFENDDYEVVYTDANGTLKFEDNALHGNERLEYHAHTTSLLTSDTEYNGSLVKTGAMIAHISTSRLMDANKNDARLEVRDKEGNVVFSIPFIKYVLEMQTYVNGGSKASQRDYQYYLDCEDTYNCSFYLTGENGQWSPARIIINNWVMVPEQSDELK